VKPEGKERKGKEAIAGGCAGCYNGYGRGGVAIAFASASRILAIVLNLPLKLPL
jgi:hypothetical protein